MEHNEKEPAEVEEEESRGGGRRKRERERRRTGLADTMGYSERERKRDVFLPKGTFCAGFARPSLLGEAARTRRATPRRRRNRPRVLAGKVWWGQNELSVSRARVGTAGDGGGHGRGR